MPSKANREYPYYIIVFAGSITPISKTTTLSSDQLDREITDLSEEVRTLDGEYEDLRSLVLGLGIPSLIISSSLVLHGYEGVACGGDQEEGGDAGTESQ